MANTTADTRDSQSRKVGISRGGNPSTRPVLTRIYGTLACLFVTLVLIAVIIVLQKTLPDGSKSKFQPSWRRSLEDLALAQRERPTSSSEISAPDLVDRGVDDETFDTNPFAGMTGVCTTPMVTCTTPEQIFKRAVATTCFTVTVLTPCTTTHSSSTSTSRSLSPCETSTVSCTTSDVPDRLGRRYPIYDCTTSFYSERGCGVSTTSTSTSRSLGPCETSTVSCTTSDVPDRLGRRYPIYDCTTSFYLERGCGVSTTSTSTSTSLNPCETSSRYCAPEHDCVITHYSVPGCGVSTSTSTSSPTPTATSTSLGPCMTSAVSCTTIEDEPKRLGRRSVDCSTSFYSVTGCGVSSSPTSTSSPTPTSSSSSTSSSMTIPPTTTPPSSLGPCMTSTVTCTPNERLDRRFVNRQCTTSFYSISGCGVSSSSSSSSAPITTPSSSLGPCETSTVSCTTYEVPERLGRRYMRTDCATSFYSVTGCGVSSPSSSSVPSTTPSSVPTTTLPSSSSPSLSTSGPTPSVPSLTSSIVGGSSNTATPSTGLPSLTDSSASSGISSPSVSLPKLSSSLVSIPSASNSGGVTSQGSLGSGLPSSAVSVPSNSQSGSISLPLSSGTPSAPSGTASLVPTRSNSLSASVPLVLSSGTPSAPSGTAPTGSISLSASIPTVVSSAGSLLSSGSLLSAPTASSASGTLPLPILVVSSSSGSPSPAPSGLLSSGVPLSLGSSNPAQPSAVTPTPGSSSGSAAPYSSNSPLPSPLVLLVSSGISQITSPAVIPSETASVASIPSASGSATVSGQSGSSASIPSSLLNSQSNSATPSGTNSASNVQESEKATGTLAPGGGGGGGGPNPSTTATPIGSNPDVWPISQAVLGSYVPIIISRAFVYLLSTLYQQTLNQEPIRQLMSPGGASSSVMAGSPGSMIVINLAAGLAQLGSAFSAGATFVDTGYCDDATQASATGSCPARISSNPWVMDVILATLLVQLITILFVMSRWWRKPGGLSADPTTIAGVAVVMGHPVIETEFSRYPAEMTSQELVRRLGGKKFRLGTFDTDRGTTKYGIMPADKEKKKKKDKDGFLAKFGNWWWKFQNRFSFLTWRKNRLYLDVIFIMLLLALLGLSIAAVSRIDKPQVVFLATAAASATGMRIFFAILGVIVSSHWGRLCQDMQTFAPYVNLGGGSANPTNTITLRRHSNPITSFFPLLRNGHFTAASVAISGLAAELLVVALSGLPYRPGQLRGEFLFWGIVSLAILSVMVAQLVIVNFWRRSLPHLPRAPNSIAAVMTYVASTSMARDFDGLEHLSTSKRNRRIQDLGKSYAYGWRREEDGRIRWVVDEVAVDEHKSLMDEVPADERRLPRDDLPVEDQRPLRDELPAEEHRSLMGNSH